MIPGHGNRREVRRHTRGDVGDVSPYDRDI
jgi:hypothetical protein